MTGRSVTVGDTAFGDVRTRAWWLNGPVELSGALIWRTQGRGGGNGWYGDVTAAWWIGGPVALVASAGVFPSDPVSGSIAGRYVTVGLRLAPRPAPRPLLTRPSRLPGASSAGADVLDGATAGVEEVGGRAVLVVRVRGKHRVEVMGDFTGWEPVTLGADGGGQYRSTSALPPGLYHFNLRVDGGPWSVPRGVGVASDEFGGSVGILVVQ